MAQSHLWLCHWERIDGRPWHGRSTGSVFWICEYPYRTIRADGPGDDCAGCPVWDAMQKAAARRRRPVVSADAAWAPRRRRVAE